jgi:hypothetical protein
MRFEKHMIRFVLCFTVIFLLLAGSAIALACPLTAVCPMHTINSMCQATGETKLTLSGNWAEYQCPGLDEDPPHKFWVKCD